MMIAVHMHMISSHRDRGLRAPTKGVTCGKFHAFPTSTPASPASKAASIDVKFAGSAQVLRVDWPVYPRHAGHCGDVSRARRTRLRLRTGSSAISPHVCSDPGRSGIDSISKICSCGCQGSLWLCNVRHRPSRSELWHLELHGRRRSMATSCPSARCAMQWRNWRGSGRMSHVSHGVGRVNGPSSFRSIWGRWGCDGRNSIRAVLRGDAFRYHG